MSERKNDHSELIEELLRRLNGGRSALLQPGELHGTLQAGDLLFDIEIKARRRVPYDDSSRYIDAALAHLESRAHWEDCNAAGTTTNFCKKKIAAVVVYEDSRPWGLIGPLPLTFRFRCAAHADQCKTARDAIGVFALPKYRLGPIQRFIEKRAEERARQLELDRQRRVEAHRQELKERLKTTSPAAVRQITHGCQHLQKQQHRWPPVAEPEFQSRHVCTHGHDDFYSSDDHFSGKPALGVCCFDCARKSCSEFVAAPALTTMVEP